MKMSHKCHIYAVNYICALVDLPINFHFFQKEGDHFLNAYAYGINMPVALKLEI